MQCSKLLLVDDEFGDFLYLQVGGAAQRFIMGPTLQGLFRVSSGFRLFFNHGFNHILLLRLT